LYTAIRAVLEQGIARQGASINWYRQPDGTRGTAQESLNAYGRTGEPCFRCGTPLERIIVGQRSTHYCPACQR
jgi:formamidopyrimidine-DNA glycosylase